MPEDKIIVIGDYIDPKKAADFDLSSTLRLRAKSIDQEKLWESKDRSAEFMGDIWSLFVDSKKEERIKTVLHSVCVELLENSVKYGQASQDYTITIDLCLRNDELLIYVVNISDLPQISALEEAAHLVLETDNIRGLFKQKMREAKEAKKQGKNKSQLGFVRILMQDVRLAWKVKMGSDAAVVTTLAMISLTKKDVQDDN